MTTTLTARLRRHLRVKRYAASGSGEEAAFHKKMIYDTDPGDYTPHSVYMDYLEDAGHGTLAGFLRRSLARQHEAGDAAGSEHAFEGVHYRSPDMGRAYPATYQSLGRVGHLHVAAAKPKRGGIELSVAPAESYTDEAIVNGVPFHYRTRLTANEAHDLADSMDNVSAGGGPAEAGSGPSLGGELRDYLRKRVLFDTRPKQLARRRYASYDVSTPSVSISIPVPGPAAPAPKPKPAPQSAPVPAPAPPAATAPAPEPSPRAFIFPFAPAPKRRMARGKPRRYAHADEPAMHAAIAANPQDNTAGHAYSDMLEENGKPAHAEVVRNYIKRTWQPAMVRRRGMLDWTADPDIPWETGVMAGPVGHLEPADRDYQTDPITEQEPGWWRVHLFRRTPDNRILHWTASVNGQKNAADLVRRLHAEAQQSVPPGGEVLLDHHAGNFVHLPDRYQRLARRTLTVRPHAEPESVVLLPGRRSLCVPPESPARKVLLARLRARRRQG